MTKHALGHGGRGRHGCSLRRRWLARAAVGAAVSLVLVLPAAAQEASEAPDPAAVVVAELNACLDSGFLGISGCVDAALANLDTAGEDGSGDATTDEATGTDGSGSGESAEGADDDGADDAGATEDGGDDTGGEDGGAAEGAETTGGTDTGDASGADGERSG